MDLETMTEHIIVLQITFVYPEMLDPIIRTFLFKCNGVFFWYLELYFRHQTAPNKVEYEKKIWSEELLTSSDFRGFSIP